MRRTMTADTSNPRSDSEIGFVLRGAHRATGPEMLRRIAAANAGPSAPKRKAASGGKAKKPAKRRKA